jgi:ATP-binding cassette, subfamily B, bacterial MsbA
MKMGLSSLKDSRSYLRFLVLRKFFNVMGVKPIHILLPIVLSFITASLDGIGIGLLIPLARGVVSDFGFVKEIPFLGKLIAVMPSNLLELTPNRSVFLYLVFICFFIVLLKNLVFYISSVITAYWHGRFKRNVYKYIFSRFLSFGKLFFDRTNQGYINMVLNYSSTVMDVLNTFEKSVNNFFTLVVYFIIMLVISWRLTIVTMVVFPLLYYSLKVIVKQIYEIAHLINDARIELNKKVFNILSCIPLVKAYTKEEETKGIYADFNERLRKLDFKMARTERLIQPIQEVVITAVLLFMIAIVALIIARDKPAEISIFVVFFYAARRSLPLFNIFNDIKASFSNARPPLKELVKVLDDKEKFFITEGEKIFNGLQKGIDFVNLDFYYMPEATVLKNVNFSIEKGKMTAIVGPTGSGKTTLISLLMRFYDCPPCSIMIDGVDIKEFTLKSLRERMALVSQEVLLFNDTLRNNITFGLDRDVDDEELKEVVKKARLYDFVNQLSEGFETEIGDRGIKLSGGEKQRVAIARAFLKGSEILILDEATSSLDSKTEILIQEAINEAAINRTTIVIAHRLSTIRHADKIAVLEEGRVVEWGSLQELLSREGKFYEYWEAQKFY